MTTLPLKKAVLPSLVIGVLALAGCGSNSDSSATAANDASQSSGQVVTVSDATGRSVLVNADGRALYVSDEEKGGRVLCTSAACGAIWTPVTVSDRNHLTVPPPLAQKLGTVARPDGNTQVTFDGRPLYTFSFDHSAGQVNGDGTQDSFDGTDFTWHVATPSGHIAAAPTSPSSSSSSPYSKSYGY